MIYLPAQKEHVQHYVDWNEIDNTTNKTLNMKGAAYHNGGCGCGVLSSSPTLPNVRTPGLLTHLTINRQGTTSILIGFLNIYVQFYFRLRLF